MYYYCTLVFVWSTIYEIIRNSTVLVLSYSYILLSFSYVLLSCSYVILFSVDIRRRMKDWQRAAGFVFVLNTTITTFVFVFCISILYARCRFVLAYIRRRSWRRRRLRRGTSCCTVVVNDVPAIFCVCRWRVFNAVAGLAIITAPLRLHLRERVAVKDPRGRSFVLGIVFKITQVAI